MAASVIADASFLIALLNGRDANNAWAAAQARRLQFPWLSCESALSEAFHLLQAPGAKKLAELLHRGAVVPSFHLKGEVNPVLELLSKYADVPMSFADACLVRMTETMPEPLLLTTDTDFRIYRRHSRQAIPCAMPE
jgi:predicted nucleic acid-binding protein